MINQAGFIYTYSLSSDLWLGGKACQASLRQNSAHLKKNKDSTCVFTQQELSI